MSFGLPSWDKSLSLDLEWGNYREVPVIMEKVGGLNLRNLTF